MMNQVKSFIFPKSRISKIDILDENQNHSQKINSSVLKKFVQPKVTIYSPLNENFTIFYEYELENLVFQLEEFEKSYLIIQVDIDDGLMDILFKKRLKKSYEDIYKSSELKLDYCFSTINDLLLFNLSIINNFKFEEVEKSMIQLLIYENGIYIINKHNSEHILNTFIDKFNFIEDKNGIFWEKLKEKEKLENLLINNTNLQDFLDNQNRKRETRRSMKSKTVKHVNLISPKPQEHHIIENNDVIESESENSESSFSSENINLDLKKNEFIYQNETPIRNNDNNYFNEFQLRQNSSEMMRRHSFDSEKSIKAPKSPSKEKYFEKNEKLKKNSNFSTDDLIYWLMVFSLDKLEELSERIIVEAECLKNLYRDIKTSDRKNFFRKIHATEVSMQLMSQETLLKKHFLKTAKSQFVQFNKLTNDFYFKSSFYFLIELMIARVQKIDSIFKKLESDLKMIKENYSIMIDDQIEKDTTKLNEVMKVLTIISLIYTPINLFTQMYQMNITLPFQNSDGYSTFFSIILILILFSAAQIYLMKLRKWI